MKTEWCLLAVPRSPRIRTIRNSFRKSESLPTTVHMYGIRRALCGTLMHQMFVSDQCADGCCFGALHNDCLLAHKGWRPYLGSSVT